MVTSPIALWREGDWRCEAASWRRRGGPARGLYGEAPVMAEASVAGRMAEYRAEILRLRVLRGDLRAPE